MDPVLIGGLNFTGLLRFQDCLAEWGIRTPNDLAYFNEWDFCSLGMTRLESRKLLSLSAVAAMLPQTTTYPAPEQQIDVTAGMRNVHVLAAAVTEAEGFAYSSLNTSLEIAERLLDPEHVSVISVKHAMLCLVEPPQVPSQAMEALNAVSRAVAFCPNHELRKSLDQAKQAIRDALVWRAQANTPWGNRPAFIAELEQANGEPLENISLAVSDQS